MPNSINIPTPRLFTGDADEKISQMHSYLFQLAEQLAMILNSISVGGTTQTAQAQSSAGDVYSMQTQLKQQIVDTAATLREEADETETALQASINATNQSLSELQGSINATNQSLSELQGNVNAISLASLGMRRGIVTTTGTLADGQYEDIQVSFDVLTSVPVVVAGLVGGSDDAGYGGSVSCRVLAGTITASGFTMRITSSTGQTTGYSYSAAWIAVG